MVKGVSRQVILVQSPDPKIFEQAIFIVRDDAPEITDEHLLKEANRLISRSVAPKKRKLYCYGAFWALVGSVFTAALWLVTTLL